MSAGDGDGDREEPPERAVLADLAESHGELVETVERQQDQIGRMLELLEVLADREGIPEDLAREVYQAGAKAGAEKGGEHGAELGFRHGYREGREDANGADAPGGGREGSPRGFQ